MSNLPYDLSQTRSLIEVQLPVAKLSAESYRERKAVAGQTLTGLGKWWGRKPLVLVRATILGLLLPATDNPKMDREIFLKLITMDEGGLLRRRKKGSPADWEELSYSDRIQHCQRPEQIDGPSELAWSEINNYLGTSASSLPELVEQLGQRRFGHRPRVGDSFCGGGSVPFEAARLGCDAYGSDLNPVAGLLTWAALNIVGGGEEVARRVQQAQKEVFEAVDRQICDWGIEHNELGWRADAYLYCVEAVDPESGYVVPLAPSWVIAEKPRVIARLKADHQAKRFDLEIVENPNVEEFTAAKMGTVKDSRMVSPLGSSTPIQTVRRNLRMWDKQDLVPRPSDVFQERLYCIRWVETYTDEKGKQKTRRHYRAPTEADLKSEQKVLALLEERFDDWQAKGYIPSRTIEPGDKTDEPIRTRGWTHWHQLFTPRQLLQIGLFSSAGDGFPNPESETILLLVGRLADWNSRLCVWLPSQGGIGGGKNTFLNQALNTNYNYSSRPFATIGSLAIPERIFHAVGSRSVHLIDGRSIGVQSDMWITDPPYADAVNYEELTEFFLAWYEGHLKRLFPDWYTDSKRSLAVKGNDLDFRQAMVECYRRLAQQMPNNGLQVVMFTHQDAGVWADLATILWAAGLRVTAAWTIATETNSALKEGNYVQGTVLLVLRKRTETEAKFMFQLVPEIEQEVRQQLDEMTALEDASDPNFTDSDYQLAAYAAALRVLTAQPIEEVDPQAELLRVRARGQENPLKGLIEQAVKIAADHQVPRGFDRDTWKRLLPVERYYLKGLELEAHGERRSGAFQELARGFGVPNYDDLFADKKANQVRLMAPSELKQRYLGGDGIGGTLLRQVLFAVYAARRADEARAGLDYLKTELGAAYWSQNQRMRHLLEYLAAQRRNQSMDAWKEDGHWADLLLGLLTNDYA